MRAAVFTDPRMPLSIEAVEPMAPDEHDVVVRVSATALCHTDVTIARGIKSYGAPLLAGHEACGVVEWIGAGVRRVKVGDRVVASTAPKCGACWFCTHGHPNVCVKSSLVRDRDRARRADGTIARGVFGLGTFAELMTVDEASVVPVRTELPDAELALLGCGVTTGLGAVLGRTDVGPGNSIAVIGCGGVGLAAIQGARIAGAEVIVAIDTNEARRALARTLGASHDSTPAAAADVVAAVTGARGVDATIDAVGLGVTMRQAFDVTRRAGTVVLVGMPEPEALPFDAWEFFLSEKRISSSLYGSVDIDRDMQRFADLAASGDLDLGALVSQQLSLDDVNAGLAALEDGTAIRSVVVP